MACSQIATFITMNMLDSTPATVVQIPDITQFSRQALALTTQKAYRRHLTVSTLGVISLRLPLEGQFLITPFESSLGDIKAGDICLVDADSTMLEGAPGSKFPPETNFHLKAFLERPDINAIAHLYPPYSSAYAARNQSCNLRTVSARREIKEILKVVCLECISRFCGLCSCRTDIRVSYTGVNVLFLKEDGMVILGASLKDVLNLAELTENTAQVAYRSSIQLRI